MTKSFIYRFIRLDWQRAEHMAEELNTLLHPHEEAVSISSDSDEVLILVKCPVKGKK